MIGILAALAVLAGDDFPLQTGARWVYVEDGKEVMILDALEPETVGDQKTVPIRVRGGAFFWCHNEAVYLTAGPAGLRYHAYRFQGAITPKDPPYLLVPPKLEKGATWASGPDEKIHVAVEDTERITVPAGEFQAWRMGFEMHNHLGTEEDFRAWYVAGTGFVRFEFWQESQRGEKKPLPKPYRYDLARFEPKRVATPVLVPPLSDADRSRAEAMIAAGDVDGLVALGRGVIPVLRGRLPQVQDRLPKLEFRIIAMKEKGKVGEPLPIRFALRNLTTERIQVVPSIHGSDLGRAPRYDVVILDAAGVAQEPKNPRFCFTLNPLEAQDFITLEPGEELDPLGTGTFRHYKLDWKPTRPGTYTVDALYDATGKVPDAWQGFVETMDPAVRTRLDALPKLKVEAKRLTIVVE